MLFNIIGVTVIMLVGSVVMYWLQTNIAQSVRSVRVAQAKTAKAKVIEIEAPAILGRDDHNVSTALSFEVLPENGKPFKARSLWLIEAGQIPGIHAGRMLPVRIDSKTQKIIYPDVAWAKYDWLREHETKPIFDNSPSEEKLAE
jgi:hypothetical protein